MTLTEKLRYFDQSEMGHYIHEDSKKDFSMKLPKKPVKRIGSAMLFFGLIAGSIGVINYLDKAQLKESLHTDREYAAANKQ